MANEKILVVEDEAIVALHITTSLKNMGYSVTGIASSLEEALRKTEEANPDLVLMDISLKGSGDGIKAAEQIRTRFNIPVIYLTANSDDSTLQRAKITEPFGYILKPFKERELHIAIEIALFKYRMETERERINIELKKALDHIKRLHGLLPICSSCKRIRDDKGYWNQIEVYISEHSEAEFSHGLCPECLKTLYPDYKVK